MAAHTPGPWEARCFLVMGGQRLSDRICHVGTSTSLPPARSHESEANARLIAAAPDLLEALQQLRHAVCGRTGFASAVRAATDTAYPWPALDIAEEAAVAAIAKAEGKP